MPLPLNTEADSGSGIRPLQMLEAFKSLGYNVDLIAGFGRERRRCIRYIKDNISNGVVYEFLYSESSTMPTLLTEQHHLPLYPFVDFSFFNFCQKQSIPIGLFYRDIYWLFHEYSNDINKYKAAIAIKFYYYDLNQYRKYLSRLYLPSIEMAQYLPMIDPNICAALPPGYVMDNDISKVARANINKLKLLYIGGIGNHYQMHQLFDALKHMPDVELLLCTREAEWHAVQHEYLNPLPKNINIIHKSGDELRTLFDWADIAVLFVKPHEYRSFAAPLKLYEYLGNLKPIIASQDTGAGQFVDSNRIGWVVPYQAKALKRLLQFLLSNPKEIEEKKIRCREISPNHSWQARAQYVVNDMISIK